MLKQEYHDYLKSDAWKHKRVRALARASGKCQLCSANQHLQVHHNTYDRVGNEIDTDLIVLCNRCHEKFHGKGEFATTPVQSRPRQDFRPHKKKKKQRKFKVEKQKFNKTAYEVHLDREFATALARDPDPKWEKRPEIPTPTPGADVVLTLDLLDKMATDRNGYTGATLSALGVHAGRFNPRKGWRRRLVGTTISAEIYQAAMDGRTKIGKKQQKRLRQAAALSLS